jgi:hypothetical protein
MHKYSKKHASKRNFRDGGSDNECRRENKGSRSHRDDGKKYEDDDVYLDKLQTRGVKKSILYM